MQLATGLALKAAKCVVVPLKEVPFDTLVEEVTAWIAAACLRCAAFKVRRVAPYLGISWDPVQVVLFTRIPS